MGKYHDGVTEFFKQIAAQAAQQKIPRRKAILENYLVHAALEYTDRWPEIFIPERTVEQPVYKVRWGTAQEVVYEGDAAVKGFYRELKDDKLLTNQDQLLAVDDWGFASFLNINLFMDGAKASKLGFPVDTPDGKYVLVTPCAMYWTYDEKVRLIGEYVYEVGAGTLRKVDAPDHITYADVQKVVAPYLPALSR